ncbi:MarR family winged helix-turn-helix transcriptional regulator [Cryptosporangium aurantiacum]|uniref:DNA-binding transcriptional regulator, MarR family n=1 Tax=Cryptosporangium aurantiacum TaxID=134849 RepID=A0A1M7RLF8_9ACTN|nr:MarR family transcriptional regulator [Cryptosporangium aurantiacum]SHN47010.1 DNA-binding transcriptional regulator, MarR family [Cryptosporangium aurantiacum]
MASTMQDTLSELGRIVQSYQAANDDTDRETARILRVNRTDLRCLELLLDSGGVTPRSLGDRLGLTTGSVTAMLDRLERLGFLTRNPHPDDGRKLVVTITSQGAERCYALFAPLVDEGSRVMAEQFTVDELQLAIRFLRTLTDVQNRHVSRLADHGR